MDTPAPSSSPPSHSPMEIEAADILLQLKYGCGEGQNAAVCCAGGGGRKEVSGGTCADVCGGDEVEMEEEEDDECEENEACGGQGEAAGGGEGAPTRFTRGLKRRGGGGRRAGGSRRAGGGQRAGGSGRGRRGNGRGGARRGDAGASSSSCGTRLGSNRSTRPRKDLASGTKRLLAYLATRGEVDVRALAQDPSFNLDLRRLSDIGNVLKEVNLIYKNKYKFRLNREFSMERLLAELATINNPNL